MKQVSDPLDHADLTDTSQGVSQFRGQDHHVVLAYGHHLDAEGELVVVDVAVGIVRDELLGVLVLDRDYRGQKVDQLFGSRLGAKVKVESVCERGVKKEKKGN